MCNHCYSGKAISTTYSECVSVLLVIQHAMCLRHVVMCPILLYSIFPLSHTWHGFRKTLLCYVHVLLFFSLDTGLLARSHHSEGPATGHLDTGFSWFPCVYKQMLRWFPRFQFATTCFSCSPPDLNLVVTNFMFCIHVK